MAKEAWQSHQSWTHTHATSFSAWKVTHTEKKKTFSLWAAVITRKFLLSSCSISHTSSQISSTQYGPVKALLITEVLDVSSLDLDVDNGRLSDWTCPEEYNTVCDKVSLWFCCELLVGFTEANITLTIALCIYALLFKVKFKITNMNDSSYD